MARSPRGVPFFACAKKGTKESTPRSSRPSRCAAGVRVADGNFGTAHPVPTQNAARRARRPAGLPTVATAAEGAPEQGPKAKAPRRFSIICCCFGLSGPRSGVASGPGKTRRACPVLDTGAAHKDVRRFRQGQDAPSGNSRADCGPGAKRRARRQGCVSFGYFSLHKQRKVTPRGKRTIGGNRWQIRAPAHSSRNDSKQTSSE